MLFTAHHAWSHIKDRAFNKRNKIAWVWGSYNASVVTEQSGSGKIYLVVRTAGIWTKIMALCGLKP